MMETILMQVSFHVRRQGIIKSLKDEIARFRALLPQDITPEVSEEESAVIPDV